MSSAHQEKVAAAVETEKAVDRIATGDKLKNPLFGGFYYLAKFN